MQFGSTNTDTQKEVTRDKFEDLCGTEFYKSDNVSDMEFSESPRSSTSAEIAEFSIPSTQSNDENDENEDALSSDESEVNLPAGACN